MRNKNTKTTYFMYSPYECSAVEEYLEIMAEKGWLLQSIRGAFLKFKRIEPRKMKFSVDILDNISIFDVNDTDEALNYREYCEVAGWIYVCQTGKIQVFYAEDYSKTIPIHTDEREKFKSVFKYSLFSMSGGIFLSIIFIFNLNIINTEFMLTSNLGILSAFVMVSSIVINIIQAISFLVWVIRTRIKLKDNKSMPYNNYKHSRLKNSSILAYVLINTAILLIVICSDVSEKKQVNILMYIIIFIPIIIMVFIQKLIKKKRYSKNTNRAITIGGGLISIYFTLIFVVVMAIWGISIGNMKEVPSEKVALRIEDFGYKEDDGTEIYFDYAKSILAEKIDYSYYIQDNGFNYICLNSRYSWVIKLHESRLVKMLNRYGIDLNLKNTNLPSNIKVYSDGEKYRYVLVSEDKVVNTRNELNGISEEEFLNKIYEALLAQ